MSLPCIAVRLFDLRAFKARGGKMLMWHGMSDAASFEPHDPTR